jgi:hypothetical protein
VITHLVRYTRPHEQRAVRYTVKAQEYRLRRSRHHDEARLGASGRLIRASTSTGTRPAITIISAATAASS